MVSNTVKNRAHQEDRERTHINAALAAFQQVEMGNPILILYEERFDPVANRFFSRGDAVYGASEGIQTLVREGYSLERPLLRNDTTYNDTTYNDTTYNDTTYILASLAVEVINKASIDILLESPAQDLQHRVALLAEQLLYQQMTREDKAMTRLYEDSTVSLSALQQERNTFSTLLKEFDAVDLSEMIIVIENHALKMREYAALCLENAAARAVETLNYLFDHDAPETAYREAKARFDLLYTACSEMYGMQPAFRAEAEQYRNAAQTATAGYITAELETYQELIETAKRMSGNVNREELADAIRAITHQDQKVKTAIRRTHPFLSSTEFREYTQQYSRLQNDEEYNKLTAEVSGPQYLDDSFMETITKRVRVTALIPSDELYALVQRKYDDMPTVIRTPRTVEVQPSF